MKLQVGDKVKVVGKKGGCFHNKCYKCYKGKTIIVTHINIPNYIPRKGERNIEAKNEKGDSHCSFVEEDLQLLKITNWRKRIQ